MASIRFLLGSHVALVLLLVQPCIGSEFTFLMDHPGKVSVIVERTQTKELKLSAGEAGAFNANLERLRGLLLAQPVFNPPLGVKVAGYIRAQSPIHAVTRNAPATGHGYIRFHFSFLDKKTGKPDWVCCTTDEIQLYINQPGAGFDSVGLDDRSRFYNEPKQIATLNGFPVYRTDQYSDEIIVLYRGAKPLWVPVTREEYVKMWLRMWEESAAKSVHDTVSPVIVERHKAALARMSAEERQMQVRRLVGGGDPDPEGCGSYPQDPYEPQITPAGCLAGRPLVKFNPNLFDPSLPRSVFQLITFRFVYGPLNPDQPGPTEYGDISPYRVWEALHRSDWAGIGAALTTK